MEFVLVIDVRANVMSHVPIEVVSKVSAEVKVQVPSIEAHLFVPEGEPVVVPYPGRVFLGVGVLLKVKKLVKKLRCEV